MRSYSDELFFALFVITTQPDKFSLANWILPRVIGRLEWTELKNVIFDISTVTADEQPGSQ